MQWTSAGFALLAAILWLLSAMVKLPPPQITFESIDQIVPALQRQGAAAAIYAAVTAAIQAILIAAPTCISLG